MTDLMVPEEAVAEPRALIRADDAATAGTLALALMSDQEFDTRLAALKRGRDRMAAIQRGLMDKDVDYGKIPGTEKPTLYKPGAEKLCDFYHLAADFHPERIVGDNLAGPALAYQTRCELHLGSLDGPVVAVGYGSANSWERKHRYRTAQRACPACGCIGTLNRSKRGKPEWYCWAKRGGCGKTFPINDPTIVDQEMGQVENPDPWDLDTTLLKMAEKRAHIDATLRGTAASGLFTQDVEDTAPAIAEEEAPPPEPQTLSDVVDTRWAEEQAAQLPEPTPEPVEAPGPSEAPTAPETMTEAELRDAIRAAFIPTAVVRRVRDVLYPEQDHLDGHQRAVLWAELQADIADKEAAPA